MQWHRRTVSGALLRVGQVRRVLEVAEAERVIEMGALVLLSPLWISSGGY